MKNDLLIGESGGTKTDWLFLKTDGTVIRESGHSLHPENWSKFNWSELESIWTKMGVSNERTDLKFYGAGCNSSENARQIVSLFKDQKFSSVMVFGDLRAAGIATWGKSSGYTAILGSGSVLIDYHEGSVRTFYGGKGRENGDEGSGFYFGKLLLSAFQDNKLKPIQISLLKSCFTDAQITDIKKDIATDEVKLKMALLLSNYLFEFQDFHAKNFQLFFDKYVIENVSIGSTISFVGSYAYFHQAILKTVCQLNNYEFGIVAERPIEQLENFYKKSDE